MLSFLNIASSLYSQKKTFRREIAKKTLTHLAVELNPVEKLILKRTHLYGVQVAGYFGEVLCALYGMKFNKSLRFQFASLGACVPILDGLTDELGVELDDLQKLISTPPDLNINSFLEIKLTELFNELQMVRKLDSFFFTTLQDVFEAQKMSLEQKKSTMNFDNIESATYKKGGSGALLFLSLVDSMPSKETMDAIYKIGAWVQICDDAFDIQRDRKENIKTIPSLLNDPKMIGQKILSVKNEAFEALKCTHFPEHNIKKTLRILSLYSKMVDVFIDDLIKVNAKRTQDDSELIVPDFSLNFKVLLRLMF